MAYAEDLDVSEIYIKPPEPFQLTDEDAGGFADNLSTNQLRIPAEV